MMIIAATLLMAVVASACGGDSDSADPTPAVSTEITMVNATPCILHFRFDNGQPLGRISPGAEVTYTDAAVAAARYVKFESTRAIFRTYAMDAIRADGDRIVVRPAVDDNPCVEVRADRPAG